MLADMISRLGVVGTAVQAAMTGTRGAAHALPVGHFRYWYKTDMAVAAVNALASERE